MAEYILDTSGAEKEFAALDLGDDGKVHVA